MTKEPFPETVCFNPLIEFIPDSSAEAALAGTKSFFTSFAREKEEKIHPETIAKALYFRFSKSIPEKEKNPARLLEFLKKNIPLNLRETFIDDDGSEFMEIRKVIEDLLG